MPLALKFLPQARYSVKYTDRFWLDASVVCLGNAGCPLKSYLPNRHTVWRTLRRAAEHAHLLKVLSMQIGTVKFYNDQKGYGFIQPEDGSKDVFVHASALERAGMRALTEGQKVSFDVQEDRRSGKLAVGMIENA